MPAAKVCAHPNCPHVQPCPAHPKIAWQGSTRRAQLPPGWSSRIVPRILARDPICTICSVHLSREVHHVGNPHDHSDEALAGVCVACHKAATAQQAAQARRQGRA